MEQINLNLIPNGILAVCHVSQYDNTGRKIRFHLFNGSDTYALSGTETITLRIRKTNGEILIFDIPNTASDYIDLTVLQQMTNVSGDSVCEFRLTDSGLDIGSFNFKMKIEPDAFDGNLLISEVSGNIATFETDIAEDLIKLDVDLKPIQDLHGYDNPWPAGGEKNKLPPNGTDSSTTINGITFTASNGVYTIKGTSTEAASISYPLKASVDMSPSTQKIIFLNTEGNTGVSLHFRRNGSNIHYWQMHPANRVASNWADTGNELIDEITLTVSANKTVNMTISPMFLLLSETSETTFAPYSNICPISGHDSAQLVRTGKNLIDTRGIDVTVAGIHATSDSDGNISLSGTRDSSTGWKSIKTYNNLLPGNYRFSTNNNHLTCLLNYTQKTSSFTVNKGDIVRLALNLSSGDVVNDSGIKCQIEHGWSASTPYEPYESDPTPITVNFGQTVYKGKLYSELRKVLVTHAYLTVTSANSNIVSKVNNNKYKILNANCGAKITDIDYTDILCDKLKSQAGSTNDGRCYISSIGDIRMNFAVEYNSVSDMITDLESLSFVYPLAEPFYIDLSQEQTEDVERAAIASFETNIQRPLETSEHYFSCSQAEGTPTPDNPIPIDGVSEITAYRTGKNLIDNDDFFNFQSWKPNLVTVGEFPTNYSNRGYKLPTKVGETYTISFGIDENDIPRYVYLCKTDGITSTRVTYITTGSALFNRTFTFTSDGSLYYLHSGSMIDQSAFEEQIGKIDFVQLELGSTTTPYEPYSGESVTVSLGGTYYGGKIVQQEDGSRKIVLDKAFTKINALIWSYVPSFTYFNAYPTNLKQNSDAGKKLDGLTSDIYANRTAAQAGSGDVDLSIAGYQTAIRIKHKAYTDVNSFIAAVGDHDIVYPLETPIEIDLPDGDPLTTLVGENNVYCNTGDTALTYYYNMVADPIRIPALVGTNNVYSDVGDVDVEYYTTLEGGND